MIDDLIPILVPASLLLILAVVAVTKIVSDGRTRRRLIDAGASSELAAAILRPQQGAPALHGSLRWGLLIGAVGLGLIVVQFLPYGGDDPIVLGVILVFAALGLVAHYAVGRRLAVPANPKTAESLRA